MGIAFFRGGSELDCDQSPSPLSLLFLRKLGRLPLLRRKPVCFQQSSIVLSACVCFPVYASVCVCVSAFGTYRLAGCNPYYTIYCLNNCSYFVVKFFVIPCSQLRRAFVFALPPIRLFFGSGSPRSRLGSSCACRLTRHIW